MKHLWFTQIYLYRFYIPELIRLANNVETNPGPGVVDPTKLLPHHTDKAMLMLEVAHHEQSFN